jgi:molybdenum cofactor cytidylyltransferase
MQRLFRLLNKPDGGCRRKNPTAGIILAAGDSTRFGSCKQLLRLHGRLLCEWVLDAALGSRLERVVLVTGRDHDRVLLELGEKTGHARLEVVFNPEFQDGLSTSLKAGLLRAQDSYPSVMFLLADQPLVTAATLDLMLEQFYRSAQSICVPTLKGRRGNPVLFSRSLYSELLQITGDQGGRSVIAAHPDQLLTVEIGHPGFFFDIDTPDDFEKLRVALDSPRPV